MAKLRHIAITVPDPWKAAGKLGRGFVGLHHFLGQ